MDTKVISLSEFRGDLEGALRECYESGRPLIVELPNHGLVSIRPVDEHDDLVDELIERNPAFRDMLTRSLASPREAFPFAQD